MRIATFFVEPCMPVAVIRMPLTVTRRMYESNDTTKSIAGTESDGHNHEFEGSDIRITRSMG
ncbi:hypothetical protein [Nocardiopsis synnemataformans]|uniref:hypothetical protein n=1 Tax=Nocardiopsis synnemataformans TaxID=61305 RepID=UPI003EBC1E34